MEQYGAEWRSMAKHEQWVSKVQMEELMGQKNHLYLHLSIVDGTNLLCVAIL
jgi:hypothetical protein